MTPLSNDVMTSSSYVNRATTFLLNMLQQNGLIIEKDG